MSFLYDKSARRYCIFILSFLVLFWVAGINMMNKQVNFTKETFLSYDNAVATSLLEQGISEDIIATALTNKDGSTLGSEFLAKIGLSEKVDANRLFYVSSVKDAMIPFVFGMGLLSSMLMVGGTILFLHGREELYIKSEKIIRDYIDGNNTVHLSQTNEGTVWRMLSAVEQLDAILQSKNDTERKTKEFLKTTISDISHQLKTPLSALMMYQEIIENEPDNIDTVKEFSAKTGTALKRMEQLIQAMLKITRLDVGNIVFEKDNYNICNVINNAISELTTRATGESKEIVITGNPEQMIFCDMEWTGEAIGNIVKNALDHTDSGGKIHISWERTPAMLRIFIADNGHGIAPEDIHHIFKRFYRSKNTLNTQGVGLGLPLAKAIIEGQGGFLTVQSECSRGTAFTLSFLTEP
ncbi:MAG: HAMP domain-containing histidine kinase [Lachnospiraceae bacterium]|nr:HAMP domain-containing histidine kinase [Lachnospiraceae bacterium]